jgi:AraC family transcriptional regulator
MSSTDRMFVDDSALADGPQREGFVAHDFSSLNDRLTDNLGNARTNEAQTFETPVFGGLHLVSTPPTVSTPPISSVMPSTNCQETVVSRSAQLLSHAMTLLETNHDAWCSLDGGLTLLRGHLQESPANAASAAGARQRGLACWQSRAAVGYINANLASKLTLAEIAKVACISKSHFSRAFKISHGVSPWAYIIMARVERAKRMIRATREPLSQIASACGFADQAHLCNAFRRRVGVSPGIWRRAHVAVCTMDKGTGDANRWSLSRSGNAEPLSLLRS